MSSTAYTLARQLFTELARTDPEGAALVLPILRRQRCHSIDFASVVWNGVAYSFAATQARVVQLLWQAAEDGCPEVRGRTLLDAAGSESERLADLFKGNAAWQSMIVEGQQRGTFRLCDAMNAEPREEQR